MRKKVTDLLHVQLGFPGADGGLLVSDKVGEVHYINLNNLKEKGHIIKADDKYDKILFGHQQECLGLLKSQDSSSLASFDTLNRVRVCEFPNVFSTKQIILQH